MRLTPILTMLAGLTATTTMAAPAAVILLPGEIVSIREVELAREHFHQLLTIEGLTHESVSLNPSPWSLVATPPDGNLTSQAFTRDDGLSMISLSVQSGAMNAITNELNGALKRLGGGLRELFISEIQNIPALLNSTDPNHQEALRRVQARGIEVVIRSVTPGLVTGPGIVLLRLEGIFLQMIIDDLSKTMPDVYRAIRRGEPFSQWGPTLRIALTKLVRANVLAFLDEVEDAMAEGMAIMMVDTIASAVQIVGPVKGALATVLIPPTKKALNEILEPQVDKMKANLRSRWSAADTEKAAEDIVDKARDRVDPIEEPETKPGYPFFQKRSPSTPSYFGSLAMAA